MLALVGWFGEAGGCRVRWCDVVCCGMRLAERSGAGGILDGIWRVAQGEVDNGIEMVSCVSFTFLPDNDDCLICDARGD